MPVAPSKTALRPATLRVDTHLCHACGACVGACPNGALTLARGAQLQTFPAACGACARCLQVCPMGALRLEPNE